MAEPGLGAEVQLSSGYFSTFEGAGDGSWPRKGLQADAIFTLDHYVNAARIAHRGVFTNVFMSDRPQLVVEDGVRPEQLFDPFVIFPAILAQVPDIGAIVTATTQYNEPYTLARAVQSLNLLFPGRIGWNVVTSWHPAISANFNDIALPDRAARYARAEEFVEVVLKLWESWPYEWGEGELKSFGTPRPIDHKGTYFNVKGPLNLPVAPWGRPRIVQAGGSVAGIGLGARHADVVYAPLSSLEGTRAFRTELHEAARAAGRAETDLPRLLPPISPILLSSEAEIAAWRRSHAEAHPLTGADLQGAATLLGLAPGTDPDKPLTEADFAETKDAVIPIGVILARRRQALDAGQSLRAFAEDASIPGRPGTPEETAGFILDWFRAGAVDGFTVSPLNLPDDLEPFVDQVVPLLQKSGLYPRDYDQRRAAAASAA